MAVPTPIVPEIHGDESIVEEKATTPPTYLVELFFSFKGVKRVEVPAERIKAA
jgi:hypothetical protein